MVSEKEATVALSHAQTRLIHVPKVRSGIAEDHHPSSAFQTNEHCCVSCFTREKAEVRICSEHSEPWGENTLTSYMNTPSSHQGSRTMEATFPEERKRQTENGSARVSRRRSLAAAETPRWKTYRWEAAEGCSIDYYFCDALNLMVR